ncbi:HlyD family secretion protein [Roseomonas hellenica]|uniref:HlyD family secretion protein n=1 Tax=Plastoroseomonas hellenica TaxID=2687306 RepID=A0ABS5EYS1_9PROT|nr:HlyD family secretion protein [Plastoroseomonas hellenica]MBR0665434.1 HlyD family secretion protein [Plastoroseomonas hellenica]
MKLYTAALGGMLVAGSVFAAASTALNPGGILPFGQATTTDNAFVRGEVTPISPKVAGYIAELGVRDNQAVQAGDILFRIDDADYRARVAQAAAALEGRRAAIDNLATRLELQRAAIEQAAAVLQGAEAEAYRAQRDFTRQRQLTRDGWASQSRGDQAESESLRAEARVAEARANLTGARRQLAVLDSQRPQLEADRDAAAAALRLAEIDLESTVVRAPVDGWVGERQVRLGQYVRPGTQLIAVVAREIWIVANFKETQLPGITPGAAATITVDGVPGIRFTGTVDSVSPASGAQFALLPPDNATGNFTRIAQRVPVRINLRGSEAELARLRPGLSAIVSVTGAAAPDAPSARQVTPRT